MPNFVEVNPDKLEQLIKPWGLAVATLRQRKHDIDTFREYLKATGNETLEELIESGDLEKIDQLMANYFMKSTVINKDGENNLPKKNTIDGYRRNLKLEIHKLSKGTLDMYNDIQFPLFTVRFLPISSSIHFNQQTKLRDQNKNK
jgi:hypothetical protein